MLQSPSLQVLSRDKMPSTVTTTSSTGTRQPRDRYHVTLCAVFLLGLTTMLPWNSFVTASDYWNFKFRDLSNSSANSPPPEPSNGEVDLNENQQFFISYLSIVCNGIYLVVILANTFVRRVVSSEGRVTWSLLLTIFCMLIVTIFVKVDTDAWQTGFMVLTLIVAGSTSIVVAALTGSSTGLCGFLPPRMMAATSIGSSVGGTACAVAQIGCLLLGLGAQDTALIFFLLSVLVLVVTFGYWKAMEHSDYYEYYRNKAGSPMEILHLSQPITKAPYIYISILAEGWHFHLTALLATAVSAIIFPNLSYQAISTHASGRSMLAGTLFLPVACFFTYNVADFIGRYVETLWPYKPERRQLLLCFCLLRAALVPLLMFCNLAPSKRQYLPVLFYSDTLFIFIMVISGASNGYLLNAALVNAPKTTSPENQELSGSLAACCLAIGATLGSLISYLLLMVFSPETSS